MSTFYNFKAALSGLKPSQQTLVALADPTTDKTKNYLNLLKIIHDHTDLRYELEVVKNGMKIKRIK